MSELVTRLRKQRWLWLLLALTVPAWAALLAPAYFFNAHDARHSVFYLVEFDAAIRDGAWWPRWGPDHAMGYGYPLWVVYAPFAYFVGEAFHLVGFGFTDAVKATFLLGFLIGAAGAFALARRWWGNAAGLIAGLLYTYAPYHLVNIYVRAALAEFWAMAWFPWILLAFDRLIEQPANRRRLAVAGLSFAALLISHTAAMLFFTPWLLIFLGFRLVQRIRNVPKDWFRVARSTVFAGLLGFGLAAIFLIPLFVEQREIGQGVWVQNSYQVDRNFVYPHQLVSSFWGFGYSVDGPNDGMSFQLGLAPLALAAAGVLFGLQRGRQQRGMVIFLIISTLLIVLMLLPSSNAIWQLLPLIKLIQFPWRLLALTTLTLALLGASAVHAFGPNKPSSSQIFVYPIALFIVVASFNYTRPEFTPITPRDESPLAIMDFELEHPDMIGVMRETRQPFTTTPLLEQYLTGKPLQKAAVVEGTGVVETRRVGGQTVELQMKAQTPVRLVVYTYNFPGWEAAANGAPVAIETVPPYGLIGLSLPAGESSVTLRVGSTPARTIGTLISALSVIITAWLLVRWRRA